MKKWMIALMMAALLIVPMGGIAYAVGEGAPAAPAAGEFIPGDVPAQSGTMDAMVAPVNALVMCMVEQGLAYNDQDDVFLWNSLYYMLSLCGQMDERAELTDDMLILPAETVADYAGALFSNFDGLPALPREMNGRVSYDWQNDTFRLARGDAGLTETRLGEITELGGGCVQVAGRMSRCCAASRWTWSATTACLAMRSPDWISSDMPLSPETRRSCGAFLAVRPRLFPGTEV